MMIGQVTRMPDGSIIVVFDCNKDQYEAFLEWFNEHQEDEDDEG
jgi:acylphosphatase